MRTHAIERVFFLEHSRNDIIYAEPDGGEYHYQTDDRGSDDQLEFAITLFVGRRKLVLRKVWRRTV